MGRESSYGSIREASRALRCPLCLSRSPTEVLEGLEGCLCRCVLFDTMPSSGHYTWRDTMTAEQMEESFKRYKTKLMQYVKRRYHIRQDEEDIVMDAFVSAFAGKEYERRYP